MLFNSLSFIWFFIILVILYFSIPHRYRWILLLVANYYFYMSIKLQYALIIFTSTTVAYTTALLMNKTTRWRKSLLVTSLAINLGILFSFKYLNFFSESTNNLFSQVGIQFSLPTLSLLIPIGISFYTFQLVSYSVDVYSKKIEPEKHFGIFAIYVSFFATLLSGPIERAQKLIPQFREKHTFEYNRVAAGVALFLWGLFKKVMIADRLALVVETVYGNPTDYGAIPLLVATVFFAFQIYADFSGYIDMALGAAAVLGFRLTDNFKQPYFARSPADFWRRWHITLATWFQEYVFNPLYLAVSKIKAIAKLHYRLKHIIAFGISIIIGEVLIGLWHGAAWNWVLWGVYFGSIMLLYYINRSWWDKMHALIQIGCTFVLVCIGYIFWRGRSAADIWYIFSALATKWELVFAGANIGIGWPDFILASLMILLLIAVDTAKELWNLQFASQPLLVRRAVYILLIALLLLFGVMDNQQFIYFQF